MLREIGAEPFRRKKRKKAPLDNIHRVKEKREYALLRIRKGVRWGGGKKNVGSMTVRKAWSENKKGEVKSQITAKLKNYRVGSGGQKDFQDAKRGWGGRGLNGGGGHFFDGLWPKRRGEARKSSRNSGWREEKGFPRERELIRAKKNEGGIQGACSEVWLSKWRGKDMQETFIHREEVDQKKIEVISLWKGGGKKRLSEFGEEGDKNPKNQVRKGKKNDCEIGKEVTAKKSN